MGKTYRKKMHAAASAEHVAIDVGGVLSSKGDTRFDGEQIHEAAAPNAYMFVRLLHHRTGRYPQVVSRVNYPSKTHWVIRFCCSLGIPESNIHLVKRKDDKHKHSERMTAVIDDDWDALLSLGFGAQKSLKEGFWFQAQYQDFPRPRHKWDEWMASMTKMVADFWSLQSELGLGCTQTALDIFREGPPNGPHSQDLVERALAALVDNVKDEVFEEVAASATATVSSAAAADLAHAPEAQPPAEALPLESCAQDEPGPVDDDEAAPGAIVTEEAAPEKAASSSSSSSSYYDESESPAKKPAGVNGNNQACKTEPDQTQDARRIREETDSSQDASRPPRARPRLHLEPSEAQIKKEKPGAVLELKENKQRVATQQDLENAVKQITDTVMEQVRMQLPAAASMAIPVLAAPVPASGSGAWYSGGYARNRQSGWANRKAERAAADRERRQAGLSKPPPVIAIRMCRQCDRNQPGTRCPNQLCRQCCSDPRCGQHGS